ncbi:MAG: class I SAM-dependent methyltransferase [Balneolaceae bacterium]|nr:class I SAM-dependent methyltransferase [Balneolaceae bacterium]
MNLKKKLPPNRSYKQIKNQYLVEKSIAERLKKADRQERKRIFETMYDELFEQVPDHPRLTRRNSDQLTLKANEEKFSLVNKYVDKSTVFLEFAPGDCRLSFKVAKHVKKIFGVDISDQRNPKDSVPENFKLIVYDGYNLNEIESNSIDVVFSDQLIEHFHPEDTKLHFELVHRILKNGGKYIFRTPHPHSGPHDISKYFCHEAKGFHLKEWTYTEINNMLQDIGYKGFRTFWHGGGFTFRMPYIYFRICEKFLELFPKRYIKKVAKFLIPSLYGVAVK